MRAVRHTARDGGRALAELIREYKVMPYNSTVNGDPGSWYDWKLFSWNGEDVYDNRKGTKGEPDFYKSPVPYRDSFLIGKGNEYLHVAYNWKEDMVVYRVRPSDAMQAGNVYRGRVVKQTKAIKKADGWYWQVEYW